jgi:hypothetical protein
MLAQGRPELREAPGRASNSDMSDETLPPQDISDDASEECAPTERAPSRSKLHTPPRGVALSVLWWCEDEGEKGAG